LATKLSDKVLFVATGEPLDDEMQSRIAEHKKARPKTWHTLELPTGIGKGVTKQIGEAEVVIIDCITLLISNLLSNEPDYSESERLVKVEIDELLACLRTVSASFIIVSNEVGMGLVPETKVGRVYRDLLGKTNQLIALNSSRVYLMVAGTPIDIK
jgi:adenosylcobinamide kinase/adenosylcobinamide-phosphate guanylyltransferase